MKYIDLHTHSTCSDGTLSPAGVVGAAADAGLAAVALSDHDTTAGVAEAAAAGEELGIEVIPAIELSAVSKTETHILGYFIDPSSETLLRTLEHAREVRMRREREICEKLCSLGQPVTFEEVSALAGDDVVCRIHIARAMVNHGYVGSVGEAFARYLSSGRPAYSPTQALTDEEAVRTIKDAGGLAFVAHLNQTRLPLPELSEMLARLKRAGLDGVEGYYTEYTPEMRKEYISLAESLGLLLSGGSDFHGENKPNRIGQANAPYELLERMRERISK